MPGVLCPEDSDPQDYLGIEFEAPVPDGYEALRQALIVSPFEKNFHVHNWEGEAVCLVQQDHYKEALRHLFDVRMDAGHWVGSPKVPIARNAFDHNVTYEVFALPLEKRKYEVGASYGLHVHVDLRHRNAEKIHLALSDYGAREALCAFRGPYRTLSDVSGHYGTKCIPPQKYRKGYNTVEVRYLDANYDWDRTCGFIDTILDIVKKAEARK
jgi:hypothetical protein